MILQHTDDPTKADVAHRPTILGLLLLALVHGSASAACVKSVRWYDDAPYSFRAPDGSLAGFGVDLARETLRRIGCEAHFVEMPWARALVELEAGRLDILPGSYRSAERARYAWFSVPALQSPNVLFLRRGVAAGDQPHSLDDLMDKPIRLGVQIGVSYGAAFDAMRANPAFQSRINLVTQRRNAWQMMALGRIDGMIADQASGGIELRQLGLDAAVQDSGIVVSTDTAVFALSKVSVSAALLERFNQALAAQMADGSYQRLRARYLPCPPGVEVLGCK